MPTPFIDLGSVSRRAISMPTFSDMQATEHESAAISIRLDLGGGVVLHIARH